MGGNCEAEPSRVCRGSPSNHIILASCPGSSKARPSRCSASGPPVRHRAGHRMSTVRWSACGIEERICGGADRGRASSDAARERATQADGSCSAARARPRVSAPVRATAARRPGRAAAGRPRRRRRGAAQAAAAGDAGRFIACQSVPAAAPLPRGTRRRPTVAPHPACAPPCPNASAPAGACATGRGVLTEPTAGNAPPGACRAGRGSASRPPAGSLPSSSGLGRAGRKSTFPAP